MRYNSDDFMRMCPVCRTAYGPEYTKCTQDGAELVADEVSLSDTLSSSSVMSLPPGGAAASPTPAPVVRSNAGSSSSPGSPATAAAMATEAAPRTDSVV